MFYLTSPMSEASHCNGVTCNFQILLVTENGVLLTWIFNNLKII